MNLLDLLRIGISRYPDGNTVHYTGLDAFDYYYGFVTYWSDMLFSWYRDYSWQVRVAFMIIVVCILIMCYLAYRFWRNILASRRFERELARANEKLRQPFYEFMISSTTPTVEEVEKACDMTVEEMRDFSPKVLSTMICSIRLELSELTTVPNINLLCELTGVTRYYEENLVNKHNVLVTLQDLIILTLQVSEGLLAIYINHYHPNIRHMARMCFMICTEAEPYRYLEEDLQEEQALWRPMMLHRLFGWLRDTERKMPPFLVLASIMKNEDSAAFLIEEVAYWGSEAEKSKIQDFFLSPMFKSRRAALRAVALLCDDTQEEAIVKAYQHQPEELRRESLKAVHAIGSGRYVDFFVNAYQTTSSVETKTCALTCLYSYSAEGRRAFEFLRNEVINEPNGATLLNQIDSMAILQQMRNF